MRSELTDIDFAGTRLRSTPGEKAGLQQDPPLRPAAVGELLRYTSLVDHANDRFTTGDVPTGGATPAAVMSQVRGLCRCAGVSAETSCATAWNANVKTTLVAA
jgi:hypothetical protein